MKKFLVFSLLLAAAASSYAQQDKQMLEYIEETNIGEYGMSYFYNNNQKLAYLQCDDMYGTYKKEFIYDENGNVEKLYLLTFDGFEWMTNSDVEYVRDEAGRVISRKNWNWNNGVKPEYHDAEIRYSYDADGNMLSSVTDLYRGGDVYAISDSVAYIYTRGRLTKRESYNVSDGNLVLNNYDKYEYNSKGQLQRETNYFPDGIADAPYCRLDYTYDRKGNMESRAYALATASGGFTVEDSTYYAYNTEVSAADVVYPFDPDDPKDYIDMLVSQITEYTVFNLEEMSGELVMTQIYEFGYSPFVSGVKEASEEGKQELGAAVSGGTLFILGVKDMNQDVVITDMNGRVMMQQKCNSHMLDISRLRSGFYVLSVDGKSVKFRK